MLEQYTGIYITGGTGWLGSQLLEALLVGGSFPANFNEPTSLPIYCLVLPGQVISKKTKQIHYVVGDVRNPADCNRFLKQAAGGLLIHLAGIIHPSKVADFYSINLEGTKNLLQAGVDGHLKRAVIMSSNSPIGINPHENHRFDEESPYNPYMHYGKSKKLMELVVHKYQETGKIETVLIRSPWFYGPNQPERQTLFFKMVQTGKFPIVGNGNNSRSMAYVENIVQGLLLAAERNEAVGETFWIADERPYTMNEIIGTIKNVLQNDFDFKVVDKNIHLPHITSEIAMACDALLQMMGVYHQKIHVLSEMNKTIACTIEKAQRVIGYQPQIDLKQGMHRSIKWCVEKGYL